MVIHLHPFHPLIITDALTHYAFCVRDALCISIEFNDVDSNNLASYEERTRVLYMIRFTFIQIQVKQEG